jgi:hypothetical protein
LSGYNGASQRPSDLGKPALLPAEPQQRQGLRLRSPDSTQSRIRQFVPGPKKPARAQCKLSSDQPHSTAKMGFRPDPKNLANGLAARSIAILMPYGDVESLLPYLGGMRK